MVITPVQIFSLETCLFSKMASPLKTEILSFTSVPPVSSTGSNRCFWIELTGLVQELLSGIFRAFYANCSLYLRTCLPILCLLSIDCLISCHLVILWLEELQFPWLAGSPHVCTAPHGYEHCVCFGVCDRPVHCLCLARSPALRAISGPWCHVDMVPCLNLVYRAACYSFSVWTHSIMSITMFYSSNAMSAFLFWLVGITHESTETHYS